MLCRGGVGCVMEEEPVMEGVGWVIYRGGVGWVMKKWGWGCHAGVGVCGVS